MPKGVYPHKKTGSGPVYACSECIKCGVDVYKRLSRVHEWSGFCVVCIRKRRRGQKMPVEGVERMRTSRIGKHAGENHWNWQGGITSPNDAQRAKFKRTTQKKIFQRDNYTCQVCYQYGGYLQADHIKSWASYPELRFDLSNCRTLCMACHYYVTFKRKLPDGTVWGHGFIRRVTS